MPMNHLPGLDARITARSLASSYWYATLMDGDRWVGGIPAWSWRELQRQLKAYTGRVTAVRIARMR